MLGEPVETESKYLNKIPGLIFFFDGLYLENEMIYEKKFCSNLNYFIWDLSYFGSSFQKVLL